MAGGIPPIVARVLRGERIESAHRGHGAAVSSAGRLVASAGDPETAVYLRSAAKPFQAMPLLEAGGERAFRLSSSEIALTCASHGGEPRHVRVAARLLERGGFTERDLCCGADRPMHEASARALLRRGERPTALHNNCSGKHAGLLLACRLFGFSPKGYLEVSHPIQREVLRRLSAWTGVPEGRIGIAVDGCSLPVFHVPLAALALGYARLVAPSAGPIAARLTRAMWERPEMMAGAGRFTTDFLAAGRGRWIGKEGAEALYAIGLRGSRAGEESVGLAFKIEDGSTRARDAVSLALLAHLGRLPDSAARRLASYRVPAVKNARGLLVGRIQADAAPFARPDKMHRVRAQRS
jgi:L-asparaginase II